MVSHPRRHTVLQYLVSSYYPGFMRRQYASLLVHKPCSTDPQGGFVTTWVALRASAGPADRGRGGGGKERGGRGEVFGAGFGVWGSFLLFSLSFERMEEGDEG